MNQFPSLKATLLTGKSIHFPNDVKGKLVFLTLAFDDNGEYKDQQKQSEEWQSFWQDSLSHKGVDFYEIPMMSGKYWFIRFFIDGGMRRGIDPNLHKSVACFYGNKEKYADLLALKSYKNIVSCLLDQQGNILSIQYGYPNETSKQGFMNAFSNRKK